MAAILELPSSKQDKGEALLDATDQLLQPAIVDRNVQQISWWITRAYLEGIRHFDVINFESGELEVSYEDEDGQLHMRWEEPLSRFSTEIGRIMRLDMRPLVKKTSHSIESLRNASLSQVILDNITATSDSSQIDVQFITGLVMYGTYGEAAWPDNTIPSPLAHVWELIPPWELLGIPAGSSNHTDIRAIVRTRLFPLLQLRRMTDVKIAADDAELEVVDLPYGADISQAVAGIGLEAGQGSFGEMFDELPSGNRPRRGADKPLRDNEKFVRLREFFIVGPRNTLIRYIARAGRVIIIDTDHLSKSRRVPMPIGIARYDDIGRFYGRSFMSKIIPLAIELEGLLERSIQNMADLDRFGFTFIPASWGIMLDDLKNTQEPRFAVYERDETISAGDERLFNVQPANASDLPGRTMQLGVSLMDRVVNQGPLFSGVAPGRSDSGEAFRELQETGSTHLLPLAERIQAAKVTVFRSMLYNAGRALADAQSGAASKGLELTRVDNSIAGVMIDPVSGRILLQADQLPDPYSAELGILSKDPVAKDRRRSEALGMLEGGILRPLDFIIMNYKEGWDYPVGRRDVWENYVKAVLYNLILFGDGQTPGKLPSASEQNPLGVFFNTAFDKAEIHRLAIEDFVAGPEFAMASQQVQNAFFQRITELTLRTEGRLPESAPTLEQAAIQAVQRGQVEAA